MQWVQIVPYYFGDESVAHWANLALNVAQRGDNGALFNGLFCCAMVTGGSRHLAGMKSLSGFVSMMGIYTLIPPSLKFLSVIVRMRRILVSPSQVSQRTTACLR